VVILAAIAIAYGVVVLGGNYNLYRYNKRSLQGRLDELSSAVHDYVQDHGGQLPSSVSDLVDGQYIQAAVPKNPFTGNVMNFVLPRRWQGSDDIELTSRLSEDTSHAITVYYMIISMTAYTDDGDVLAKSLCQVKVPEEALAAHKD